MVDEDGYMYFPYVGRFRVQGMTDHRGQGPAYRRTGQGPQDAPGGPEGAVLPLPEGVRGRRGKSPGVYNVTDVPFTLAEAINRSGGFLPTADDSHLILTRGDKTWTLDFQTLMTQGRPHRQDLPEGRRLPAGAQLPGVPGLHARRGDQAGHPALTHGTLSLAKALSDSGGILGRQRRTRTDLRDPPGQAPTRWMSITLTPAIPPP